MVQKTRLASILGLGAALLMSGAAHAQYSPTSPTSPQYSAPVSPSSQGAVNGQANTQLNGTVDNTNYSSVETSTETSTVGGELLSDGEPLAQTGGEPWIMTLLGASVAIGALAMRRRIN